VFSSTITTPQVEDPPVRIDQSLPEGGLDSPVVFLCHANSNPAVDIGLTITPDDQGLATCWTTSDPHTVAMQTATPCEISKFEMTWSEAGCANGLCNSTCTFLGPGHPSAPTGSSCDSLASNVIEESFLQQIDFQWRRRCVVINLDQDIAKVTSIR
jgi:hypothetical protein